MCRFRRTPVRIRLVHMVLAGEFQTMPSISILFILSFPARQFFFVLEIQDGG